MRKLSLLGLVLMGASAVTAAILPKNDSKKAQLAKLQASGGVDQLTCTLTEATVADECTYTATLAGGVVNQRGIGSRTSVAAATSSITKVGGVKTKTITDVAGKNSSQSPA